MVDDLAAHFSRSDGITKVVGAEARGFIVGRGRGPAAGTRSTPCRKPATSCRARCCCESSRCAGIRHRRAGEFAPTRSPPTMWCSSSGPSGGHGRHHDGHGASRSRKRRPPRRLRVLLRASSPSSTLVPLSPPRPTPRYSLSSLPLIQTARARPPGGSYGAAASLAEWSEERESRSSYPKNNRFISTLRANSSYDDEREQADAADVAHRETGFRVDRVRRGVLHGEGRHRPS